MATLKELNVQPGDVVECVYHDGTTYGHTISKFRDGSFWSVETGGRLGDAVPWTIVSRASDKPKTWGEMTDAEKGALLLAEYDGKVIEWIEPHMVGDTWDSLYVSFWHDKVAYRIKPEPVRATVTKYGYFDGDYLVFCCGPQGDEDTHCITFETIDGVPDCATIKMEEL